MNFIKYLFVNIKKISNYRMMEASPCIVSSPESFEYETICVAPNITTCLTCVEFSRLAFSGDVFAERRGTFRKCLPNKLTMRRKNKKQKDTYLHKL